MRRATDHCGSPILNIELPLLLPPKTHRTVPQRLLLERLALHPGTLQKHAEGLFPEAQEPCASAPSCNVIA
jgi:hypothetical protein